MTWADRLIKVRHGSTAPTYAALIAPHPALASCVRAYVSRHTLQARLSDTDRQNHFPPAPTCAITWFIQGSYAHLHQNGQTVVAQPPWPVMFTGPHTAPTVSVNPGPVQSFIVLLLPDALQALTGLDIAALVDQYRAPAQVLAPDWQALTEAVLHAPDDATRVHLIEDFLLPRWQALGNMPTGAAAPFQRWVGDVAQRAEAHAQGRSERQVDRRIKDWTGLALRQLRGIGRAESTLLRVQQETPFGRIPWADISAAAGFADQAHLSREIRRLTGMRPSEFRQKLKQESYWLYQIWS